MHLKAYPDWTVTWRISTCQYVKAALRHVLVWFKLRLFSYCLQVVTARVTVYRASDLHVPPNTVQVQVQCLPVSESQCTAMYHLVLSCQCTTVTLYHLVTPAAPRYPGHLQVYYRDGDSDRHGASTVTTWRQSRTYYDTSDLRLYIILAYRPGTSMD